MRLDRGASCPAFRKAPSLLVLFVEIRTIWLQVELRTTVVATLLILLPAPFVLHLGHPRVETADRRPEVIDCILDE